MKLYFFENYILQFFKKYIYKVKFINNQIKICIRLNSLLNFIIFLRDHSLFLYKLLIDIVCTDFPIRKKRFQLNYLLLSLSNYSRINIEIYSSEFSKINSIISIYSNSDWYERECWDLFGIFFKNHPDLRRILTDYGFDGFPLRKDFPLSGYIELYYDNIYGKILIKSLKSIQEYKFYNYSNSWDKYSLEILNSNFSFEKNYFLDFLFKYFYGKTNK